MAEGPPIPTNELDDFGRVLVRFIEAQRDLIMAVPGGVPRDQFVMFRELVFSAALSPAVIGDTTKAWHTLHNKNPEVAHALYVELGSFSAATESTDRVEASPEEKRGWKGWLIDVGKSIVDSLREILGENLGPKAKAIWKMISEALEIFGSR